jgi:hypothetical protein
LPVREHRRPSDTNGRRLLEPDLAVGDGERRSAHHRDLQMVRKHGHPFRQLLHVDPSLLVGSQP